MRFVVQPSQTLFTIARLFGLPPSLLIGVNPQITNPRRIIPGEIIEVPVPEEREAGEFDRPYIIAKGDTLHLIAREFHVSLTQLVANNPQLITRPNLIYPGQVILVPGGPTEEPVREGCLAFISTRDGGFDLYLLGAGLSANESPRRLTFGVGSFTSQPAWSPDGRLIAMNAAGGRIILVEPGRGDLPFVDEGMLPFSPGKIWSPDGRILAFECGPDVCLLDTVTFGVRQVIAQSREPQFFPDGKRLLVVQNRNGIDQLFTLSLEGDLLRQVTRNTNGPINQVALSPTGERVVYSQPGAAISVFTIVDISAEKSVEIPPGPLAQDTTPRWSPDGELLAFYSRDYDPQTQNFFLHLRLVTKDGTPVREVVRSSCDETGSLAWSPDGDRLAYVDCPVGKPDLFTVATDGSSLRRLTTLGMNIRPDWSPAPCSPPPTKC